MNTAFTWMKSTRSILAVMSFVLLALIIILSAFGKSPNDAILALVGTNVTVVVGSYFNKRDPQPEK